MADIAEALHRSNGLLSIAKMSKLSGVARTEIYKICAAAKAKTTRRAGRQNAGIDQQLARTGAQRVSRQVDGRPYPAHRGDAVVSR
jgi:hypothetical protein